MAIFDDPFSTHNPTMIGMVLGIFVLVGFGLLFLFATDERFLDWQKDPAVEIRRQKEQIDNLKEQVETNKSIVKKKAEEWERCSEIDGQLKKAKSQIMAFEQQLAGVQEKKESRSRAVAATGEEWDVYRKRYRKVERAKAKGEKYERLELQDGRVLEDVEVLNVDAVRMQVRHRGGIIGIDCQKLPEPMLDRFQFHVDEKNKQIGVESKSARARGLTYKIANIGKRMRANKDQIARNDDKINALSAKVEALDARAKMLPQVIASKQSDIQREQRKRVRNTEKLVNELNELERQQEAIPRQIKGVQAKDAELRRKNEQLTAELAGMETELAELRLKLREERKSGGQQELGES